jgi:hypothetical protein
MNDVFIFSIQNDMIIPFSKFNITEIAEVIQNYTNDVEMNEDSPTGFSSSYWSSSFKKNQASSSSNDHQEKSNSYSFAKELVENPENFKSEKFEGPEITIYHNLIYNMNSEDLQNFIDEIQPFNEHTPLFLMYSAKFCGACGVGK